MLEGYDTSSYAVLSHPTSCASTSRGVLSGTMLWNREAEIWSRFTTRGSVIGAAETMLRSSRLLSGCTPAKAAGS